MEVRTPITLIIGPLGSGKTTLLRHILRTVPQKMAILMNEFGEIAIDSKIIEGKSIRIAELANGCVCCSLQGEFEAAIKEVLEVVNPDRILVETTGVAEPDALIFDVEDNLPRVRLDGVITIADADGMVRFPHLGPTTRMQIEAADAILLNKTDLVSSGELATVEARLRQLNEAAPVLLTRRCRVDPDLLFGIARKREIHPPEHIHQPDFQSFSYTSNATLEPERFQDFAEHLSGKVYRAKGFVRFPQGARLFNFVSGRWELEPFPEERTALVFIGREINLEKDRILSQLKSCELEG